MQPSITGRRFTVHDAFFVLFRDEPRVPSTTPESLKFAWQRVLEDPLRDGPFREATDLSIRFYDEQGSCREAEVPLDPNDDSTRLFLAAMETCSQFSSDDSEARALYALFMRLGYLMTQFHRPGIHRCGSAMPELGDAEFAAVAEMPLESRYPDSDDQPLSQSSNSRPTLH